MKNDVIFVDENDEIIGYGPREKAIKKGLAHRIARIFIFNPEGKLLIQKRSETCKLPGKWDSSACGHVDKGETYGQAANREASEEAGLDNAKLEEIGKFYADEVDEGISKKRFSMLYVAEHDGNLDWENDEVAEIRWITPAEHEAWLTKSPTDFVQGHVVAYQYYTNYLQAEI